MFLAEKLDNDVYSVLLSSLELKLISSMVEDFALTPRESLLKSQLLEIIDKVNNSVNNSQKGI